MYQHLWVQCNGSQHILPLRKSAWRIIEAQPNASLRKLVDSAGEHDILETLIDTVKPDIPANLPNNMHPLLFTPFRYPPLPYGSRFGTELEPSLWYGSLQCTSAMAEKAFYQLIFLQASEANYGLVEVEFTAFTVEIQSKRAIDLSKPPFFKHKASISSRTSYQVSRALGKAMRESSIDVFLYYSARDPEEGLNIALFSSSAFLYPMPDPDSFQTWQCTTTGTSVEFQRRNALEKDCKTFNANLFHVDGKLSLPI